jgi:hypothetical protein
MALSSTSAQAARLVWGDRDFEIIRWSYGDCKIWFDDNGPLGRWMDCFGGPPADVERGLGQAPLAAGTRKMRAVVMHPGRSAVDN